MPRRKFYPVIMVAPIEENMIQFDAGPVRIGLEYRFLNPETSREALDSSDGARAIRDELQHLVDEGVSVHVFDVESGLEMLRFDCFDEDPHYHYIHQNDPEPHIELVDYDPIAHGMPEIDWALNTLEGRLAEMVVAAGYPDTAKRLQSYDGLSDVLAEVRKASRDQHLKERAASA